MIFISCIMLLLFYIEHCMVGIILLCVQENISYYLVLTSTFSSAVLNKLGFHGSLIFLYSLLFFKLSNSYFKMKYAHKIQFCNEVYWLHRIPCFSNLYHLHFDMLKFPQMGHTHVAIFFQMFFQRFQAQQVSASIFSL